MPLFTLVNEKVVFPEGVDKAAFTMKVRRCGLAGINKYELFITNSILGEAYGTEQS